ncbi:hypothetical protein [Pseudomonas putida]|uniref:Uncharacterized protein n=1 Tax=Pseudomonas putida TaxID=303 RepID=A0A8I1EAZ7_PSEPU|nr:hypothetical protein [Pseudomonas putida]MBI6883154.1 hypothetical protein [Pseudomonas putida]
MNAIEIKDLDPLVKVIIGQILKVYDYKNNIGTITPDLPVEFLSDSVTPLSAMREVCNSTIELKKGNSTVRFSPIYRMKPCEDGSFKVQLSDEFLHFSSAKDLARLFYIPHPTIH